jgi:broad specificity phosphatase PhoE
LAIVTHGGIIMYLMTLLTGSPDQFYDWQLKTACGWLITEGGIELVSAD